MKFPIIIDENGDLRFFTSKELAQRSLEPVDVEAGEYVGYDAEGRLLSMVAVDDYSVRIDFLEAEPTQALVLKEKLQAYAKQFPAAVLTDDLQGLIRFFKARFDL
ncbi:hypothetical protein [Polaromonas sp. UC242_47]|uniref:hypothetical protein n=1 Tax=Polaromonas sp. UC242_47 TaxID=3374626 RepID=UPI003788C2C7